MKILVACEESQAVTIAFREKGHEAYSCDLQPCSGGHSEWHLQEDVTPLLKEKWDMIIAFPPCTHLACSGAAWFEQKRKDGRQQQGIDFFMLFANASCKKIAIENPVGIMSKVWGLPDQIIQPWWFGDKFQKSTCLWLIGLPELKPTKIVDRGEFKHYADGTYRARWFALTTAKEQSKTFPGIAKAMVDQWHENARPLQKSFDFTYG